MGRGPGAWVVAWLSARSIRISGVVMAALAGGVIAVSVATDGGLGLSSAGGANAAATQPAGAVTPDALAAFALAHPAYPVAVAVGLALFWLGDDAPLLGD